MEQPLKPKASCNLSSINLSAYVINPFTKNAFIDRQALYEDMFVYVRAMDDVLEENLPNHALKEQTENAQRYRNLGIGVMGIHDMFIKLGIVYGSDESIEFMSDIMKWIFRSAVIASADLAKIRGNFPGYDPKV